MTGYCWRLFSGTQMPFTTRLLILLPLMVSTIFTHTAMGQTASGTLRGQVSDPSGAVIPGATVSATPATGQAKTAQTDGQGKYELSGLAPGKYTVTAGAKGFTAFRQDIDVAARQVTNLNIPLQILVEQERVTVEEQATTVDVNPSNNASVLVIQGKDLEALSDDPDELQSELEALAGPGAGPNGGQIYIDGFTGGQLPPKSSIREIPHQPESVLGRVRQTWLRPDRDFHQAGNRLVARPGVHGRQ